MLRGFKEFILRGNILDLAVAVAIGTAFLALVAAFTNSFINPLLAAAGGADNIGLGFYVRDGNAETFVDIGAFITAVITFLITAAVVYLAVVVPMTNALERRARGQDPEPEAVPEDVLLLREIRDQLAAGPDKGQSTASAD